MKLLWDINRNSNISKTPYGVGSTVLFKVLFIFSFAFSFFEFLRREYIYYPISSTERGVQYICNSKLDEQDLFHHLILSLFLSLFLLP